MVNREVHDRRCFVYGGRGEPRVCSLDDTAGDDIVATCPPTIADHIPLRRIMSKDLVCALPDLGLAAVVDLIVSRRVGCIPVVDERRCAIGVITKFDLVEQLAATMEAILQGALLSAELVARTAEDVMMPLAMTLDERSSIAHAALLMASEGMHHVLVVSSERLLVGVVSTKDIVDWIVNNHLVPDPAVFGAGVPTW